MPKTARLISGADALWASKAPNQLCALLERPLEVNQTKPKLTTVGGKICADSAGYAPQALVLLFTMSIQTPLELSSQRNWFLSQSRMRKVGGARRDRTDDLKLAKLPLSQLSFGP